MGSKMLLDKESSCCEERQKIIVSSENGRVHRAHNEKQLNMVRQYKLDGGIFHNVVCCDYLVLNDSKKDAYFIELKGEHIDRAVDQLKAAIGLVKNEIPKYQYFLRIVCSKARTQKMYSSKMRKLKEEYGKHLLIGTNVIDEQL